MAFKERLFEMPSGSWTWRFAKKADWLALSPCPEELTPDSVLVKANPLRRVFRRNGYFIKVERPEPKLGLAFLKSLFIPKAKAEFEAAQALASAGIPTVEAAGYGFSGSSQALITKALEGAVSINDYYYSTFSEGGASPEGFLGKWTEFVKLLLASGFLHPDFHNGNILYSPANGNFHLVDVFGVKRKTPLSAPELDSMRRIVFEMRRGLKPERLIKLAADCGAPGDPAQYVENGLLEEAKRLKREWPKRKEQLLGGYSKYSVEAQGGWRIALDPARRPLATQEMLASGACDLLENCEEALLRAFLLELAGLPHRRAVAFNPKSGAAFFERLAPAEPTDEELADIAFYARLFDIEAASFGRNSKGSLAIL